MVDLAGTWRGPLQTMVGVRPRWQETGSAARRAQIVTECHRLAHRLASGDHCQQRRGRAARRGVCPFSRPAVALGSRPAS